MCLFVTRSELSYVVHTMAQFLIDPKFLTGKLLFVFYVILKVVLARAFCCGL